MKFPQPIDGSKFKKIKLSGRALRLRVGSSKQLGFAQKLYNKLSKIEKVLLVFFASLLVTSFILWLVDVVKLKVQSVNFASADYVEGMIATSRADIEPTIDRLTKVGLVDFNKDGEIVGVAADSWKIENNDKKYIFSINSAITDSDLSSAINYYKNAFPKAKISLEGNNLIFELEQSFAPFVSSLSMPVFNYGPFYIAKEDKNYIQLLSRENSLAGNSALRELVVKIYPDSFSLSTALQKNEINAVASIANLDPSLFENMNIYTVELPRKIYLFFNSSTKELDLATRKSLAGNTKLSKKITIEVATLASEPHITLAQNIKEKWEALGAEVVLSAVSGAELTTHIIPERQYDALIYGIDLGYGLDLYPFWHSSQISDKGFNFANFANVEADKILEEARQTINTAKRQELNDKLEGILNSEFRIIELEDLNWRFAAPKSILGIESHTGYNAADRFRFISEWHK